MANKPLKSIQFPGLSDTYTVPQVDASLATSGAAADAKKVGDEISDLKQDFNQVDATLATKQDADKPIASAENLHTNVGALDEVPYTVRTAGGSVDIGSQLSMRKVVFGSLVWNQLTGSQDRTVSNNGITISFDHSTGKTTVTVSDNPTGFAQLAYYGGPIVAGHRNLIYIDKPVANGIEVYISGTSGVRGSFPAPKNQTVIETTAASSPMFQFYVDQSTAAGTYEYYVQLLDLTQTFGTTIADYVYSLEQVTPGTGIAWLKQFIDLDKYHAYCAPHFESTRVSAHKTVGFNQWDEVWELGKYSAQTGEKIPASDQIRSKNAVPIFPNTLYYFQFPSSSTMNGVVFFDADGNYLGYDTSIGIGSPSVKTTPANAHYLRFQMNAAYGTTYNHDICINLHWDGSEDGQYKPYQEWVYPLDSTVEGHGIWKLDANNKPYVDGDYMTADGKFHEKYGIVDLGTLTWSTYSETYKRFSAAVPDIKKALVAEIGNAICQKYVTVSVNYFDAHLDVTAIFCVDNNNSRIWVRDLAYTDSATLKTALSGVYLIYEKATETESDCDPYTEIQTTDDFGVEYFIDSLYEAGTRDVWIPCGHETLYQVDLKAKLEMQPDNPGLDGTYKWKHENGENVLVLDEAEVPNPPSEAGTYKLQVTVPLSGSPTLSWVSDT